MIKERIAAAAFCLGLAALAALPGLGASDAHAQGKGQDKLQGKTIKIGVLSDYSGVYTMYSGENSLAAIQFAVDDFLKKHPNRKVEVLKADHQNKPDVGSAIVQKWFDVDGVDAIADLPTSSVVLAVMKVASDKKKVSLVGMANSGAITGDQCNAFTAQWPNNSRVSSDAAVKALLAQGKKSWFFITVDNASGNTIEADATAIINAAGGKVVGSVKHPLGATDFSSYVLQAQSSGAQVIALANGGPDTVNSIKAAAEFGLMGKQTVVGISASLLDTKSVGLQVSQGMFVTDGWYWDTDKETRAFAERFKAARGIVPTHNMVADYSAVLHYLNAVDAAGTTDGPAVMAQMRKMPVNDVYVKNGRLREDGQMIHDYYLFQVKSPAESKGEWDLWKTVKVIPGKDAFLPISESKCPLVKKS